MKSAVKELYHDFEEIKGRNKRLSVEVILLSSFIAISFKLVQIKYRIKYSLPVVGTVELNPIIFCFTLSASA